MKNVVKYCGPAFWFYASYNPDQKKFVSSLAYRFLAMAERHGSIIGRPDVSFPITVPNDLAGVYASQANAERTIIEIAAFSDQPDTRMLARAARESCEGYALLAMCQMASRLGQAPDQAKMAKWTAARDTDEKEFRDWSRQRDQEEAAAARERAAQEEQDQTTQQQVPGPIGPIYAPPIMRPTTPVPPAGRSPTMSYPASAKTATTTTANAPRKPFVPPPIAPPTTPASHIPFQSTGQPGLGGGNSANAACINMNAAVTFTYQRPIGPGHCPGEITGRLTNRSSQRLYCRYDFYNGGMKKGDSGSVAIAPGQTMGGEGSGIYSCEADAIKFACFPDSPAAGGCPVNR